MIGSRRDRRRSHLVPAAVVLLLLAGCSTTPDTNAEVGTAATAVPTVSADATPWSTTASPAAPALTGSPTPASTRDTGADLPAVLAESPPISFAIASIGASSEILHTGLRDDGTLEVPPDGPGAPASWYDQSPTPGERGPAVFLGHVNATDGGPGVFADLRDLTAGDIIDVKREDGTTASFSVDRAEQYPKNGFPTATVYGNTEGSELRLITCDGYDPATGEFDDNYVVYATLIS